MGEGEDRKRRDEQGIENMAGHHHAVEVEAEASPKAKKRQGRTFDRLKEFDKRSRSFAMRSLLDKTYKPRSYTWSVGSHLDQGPDGACVGFAWAHELIARPAVIEGVDYSYALWHYKTAQRYDAWSGVDYSGTSVLAGAKVVQQKPPQMNEGRGLIGEYRWIFANKDDLIKTLGYFGPVIFGINWYDGMFEPDVKGFIHPTGTLAGGHAILAKAIDIKNEAVTLHQSWGEGWGYGGDCVIHLDDIMRLLNEDGECCVPMRRHSID